MSLLMDALKKAEKAKQEAEKTNSVEIAVHGFSAKNSSASSSFISVVSEDALGNSFAGDHHSSVQDELHPGDANDVFASNVSDKSQAATDEISLEPRPDLAVSSEIQSKPQTESRNDEATTLSLQEKMASQSTSSAASYSRHDANNLFTAKSARKTKNRFKNIVIGASCVVLLLFFIGAYGYYQSVSDSLQKNINDAVAPVLRQQQEIGYKEIPTPTLKDKQDGLIDRSENSVISQPKIVVPPTQRAKKRMVVASTTASTLASNVKILKKQLPEKSVASRSAPINIKRQFVPDTIYQLLMLAYSAYQVGNDQEAVSYYSKVLKQENNNRDALLGLAAISVRNNQFEKARDTYIVLLESNPKDNVALSGLINIQSNVDPDKSETKIKLLLDNEPGSPHLLFTLGSLYASQQRWAEAQKAFFAAHNLDSRNPDFAYNLAVSLDQLEQRKAALSFYRTALELVKQQPISFKVIDVMQRINVLQEVTGG